jgi:hypothetical protein
MIWNVWNGVRQRNCGWAWSNGPRLRQPQTFDKKKVFFFLRSFETFWVPFKIF